MMRTATQGEQIERYTIDRKLTEGGMAEVYLAHRDVAGFGRRVVIKSLLPTFLENRDFVAMMLNEARIAASLSHPNIVRVEDLVEVEGRPFIVMEYLDGQNLRQIVHRALTEQRRLSLGFTCRVIARMLAGLGHAHNRKAAGGQALGLVHRDVSLANVIVTWAGRVKLIDFGIAKATEHADQELTRAGQLKGKSSYMSPEQVKREALDRRSDLFSVGIVLWEMLTQRRLFSRKSEMDSMMAICCHDAAPPSSIAADLPEELDRICAKALARQRDDRYQTAEEMRQALESLMAAQGWTATPSEIEAEMAALFPEESEEAAQSPAQASADDDDEDDEPSSMSIDFVEIIEEPQLAQAVLELAPSATPNAMIDAAPDAAPDAAAEVTNHGIVPAALDKTLEARLPPLAAKQTDSDDDALDPLYAATDRDEDSMVTKLNQLPRPPSTGWETRNPAQSAEIQLLNQPVPGPSVYDDWYPRQRTLVERPQGKHAMLVVLVACLAIVAMGALLVNAGVVR